MQDVRYDVIVIGAGPAGEAAAERLHAAGMRIAVVERELIGGECAYWACIPSKTLLRATELRAQTARAAGVDRASLQWSKLAAYRDFMIRHLDDSAEVDRYAEQGIDVHKGAATIVGPGRVEVSERILTAERVVIATGSEPIIPAVDGLATAGFWTSREATTLAQLPDSAAVLGGGPVGVELSQFLARFGVEVTLLQAATQLVPREEEHVSELIARTLRADDIDLRLGVQAEAVSARGGGRALRLSDGDELFVEQLIVATGRRPRTSELGLEAIGIEQRPEGIAIDRRCRAARGVWAIGDVTGVMPFTHVGTYQGRIAADDILGKEVQATYTAIPRVVFCDPELAAVGLTKAAASERGLKVACSHIDLSEQIARPWTYEEEPTGELCLIADSERDVLVGAWAVAPLASEWIHQAALAIKAEVPLSVLRDAPAQFPTFSESYLKGIEALR